MTAVEWLAEELLREHPILTNHDAIQKAKQMEREDTDNKAIHFAEWLTKKHTLTLIALYEQFEETEYKHQSK